jgi:UDP-glucose 4-epimerase
MTANGVLVTGATTPVGSALVRALCADERVGHVLAVGARRGHGDVPCADARVHYLQVDLTRNRSMRELLFGPVRDLGIGTIVHTALHRSAADHGKRVHQLNVDTTRALVHLAERHPTVKRFVYRSFAEVYHYDCDQPNLISEDHPLELSATMGQRVRDRVAADLTVCAKMGMTPLRIAVLRCAGILGPGTGSQLWDYLQSKICFRPMGFDPMLNLLSFDDAVRALVLAVHSSVQGVFNIPGWDTLPLSRVIEKAGRIDVPFPGPIIDPIYALRRRLTHTEFSYGMNARRFHFSGILEGTRARDRLGYVPQSPLTWPLPYSPPELAPLRELLPWSRHGRAHPRD